MSANPETQKGHIVGPPDCPTRNQQHHAWFKGCPVRLQRIWKTKGIPPPPARPRQPSPPRKPPSNPRFDPRTNLPPAPQTTQPSSTQPPQSRHYIFTPSPSPYRQIPAPLPPPPTDIPPTPTRQVTPESLHRRRRRFLLVSKQEPRQKKTQLKKRCR
ncbi:serine/arginine repetitive matrix protein 1-like [Macrobrachium nipponense]|uniref:serine/arginine repetitive matrix protein 1-like n=1 Tax=Macrobrachium nipponense TaxID=159736 RepID=UPI0030C7E010